MEEERRSNKRTESARFVSFGLLWFALPRLWFGRLRNEKRRTGREKKEAKEQEKKE